jgi:hypothetical protein
MNDFVQPAGAHVAGCSVAVFHSLQHTVCCDLVQGDKLHPPSSHIFAHCGGGHHCQLQSQWGRM